MKLLSNYVALALLLIVPIGGVAQTQNPAVSTPTPVVADVQVTGLTDTSVTITFTSGIPVFGGVNYKTANGRWVIVNEAWGKNHSVVLKDLAPDTRYSYVPWASGAAGAPVSTFTTAPASGAVSSIVRLASAGKQEASVAPRSSRLPWLIGLSVSAIACIFAMGWLFRRRTKADDEVPSTHAWNPRPQGARAVTLPNDLLLTAEGVNENGKLYANHRGLRTVEVSDHLMMTAQQYTGLTNDTAVVEEALKTLIRQSTARGPAVEAETVRPMRVP